MFGRSIPPSFDSKTKGHHTPYFSIFEKIYTGNHIFKFHKRSKDLSAKGDAEETNDDVDPFYYDPDNTPTTEAKVEGPSAPKYDDHHFEEMDSGCD